MNILSETIALQTLLQDETFIQCSSKLTPSGHYPDCDAKAEGCACFHDVLFKAYDILKVPIEEQHKVHRLISEAFDRIHETALE